MRERYRVAAEDTVSEHLAGPAERRLSARLGPAALLADLGAGAVVAAVALTIAVSMGTLVYGPTGAEGAARGVGLGLTSAFALMLTVALAGTLRGAVAGAQDAPAAVVAGAVAPAAAGGALAAAADGGFATVAVMSGLTTLATGLVFVVVGWLRLGGLVRFLPYPVMGGFLAGTGWLLLLGGVSVMTDDYVDVFTIGSVLGSGWWYEVAPGLLLALCLLVVARRARTPLAFPLTVAAGVACFYLALALTGADLASWREAGLLLSGAGGGGMLRPLAPSELALADWQLVAAQLPALATVPALALVATLLNVTAAELNEPGRVDLDRQLRAAGFGNLAAGVGGGIVGYHVVSLTALNRRAGRGTNASVFVAAVLLLAALLFGGNAVGYLPRAVVGGVVSYLGLDFLDEWIATGWRRMAAVEYAIVVAILVAIALLGFLPGVALGLVLTVLLFVVSYGRVDPVRYAATGAEMRSRVRRSQAEQAALDAAADGLLVLQLQGFLFFGTTSRVLERAEAAFRERAVDTVLLDLARVTGVDASGALALLTLARRCEARGSRLWLAAVPPAVGAALSRAGAGAPLRAFPSVDAALEEREAGVLAAAATATSPASAGEAEVALADLVSCTGLAPTALEPYLGRVELAAGQRLFAQGDAADALYLVAAGRLSTLRTRDGGEPERLETMGPGHPVGEVGLLTGEPRGATVRADEPSVVYRLTLDDLARLRRDDPRAASGVYEWLARRMAGRIGHLVTTVDALRR